MSFEAIVDDGRQMTHDARHTTDDGCPMVTLAQHESMTQVSLNSTVSFPPFNYHLIAKMLLVYASIWYKILIYSDRAEC